MSGTSADAIDAALVSLEGNHCRVLHAIELPLSDHIRNQIISLFLPGNDEIDRMGSLDRELGGLFANAVQQLLAATGQSAREITAIGSHGQTIRHRPRLHGSSGFTLQIGDPNAIAEITGITTIADFRRRDMVAGGQGAPLVPAFHQAVFAAEGQCRVVLNIGGIANITVLGEDGSVRGYDTGPGNGLMDAWIFHCKGEKIDLNGAWAASGTVSQPLFAQLYSHPYFALAAPKSTGREEFSLAWLSEALQAFPQLAPQDVQATLLELTARSVSDQINARGNVKDVLVCGGGAHNPTLMQRLRALLPRISLQPTDAFGIPVGCVEAAAFAWLAMRTLNQLPGNVTAVTGAEREVILGGIYPGRLRPEN
jgi:anhydro-N-acetylmuramic acid kinase